MKLILGLALTLATGNIFACSCMEHSYSAAQVLADSDSVFLGVAVNNSTPVAGANNRYKVKTQFSIIRSFKGVSSKVTEVFSNKNDGASCGVEFLKNDALILVQTYKEADGSEWTSICSVDHVDSENLKLIKLLSDLNSESTSL